MSNLEFDHRIKLSIAVNGLTARWSDAGRRIVDVFGARPLASGRGDSENGPIEFKLAQPIYLHFGPEGDHRLAQDQATFVDGAYVERVGEEEDEAVMVTFVCRQFARRNREPTLGDLLKAQSAVVYALLDAPCSHSFIEIVTGDADIVGDSEIRAACEIISHSLRDFRTLESTPHTSPTLR
ncbi:hypothetical protein [Pararhizobium sp. PWRC1-1]|uniref:hypothetical protein n=1 Tax=Pararhizobium sp. PWRC1-1 TaxID=2804566 RepID=UPI003CF9474F